MQYNSKLLVMHGFLCVGCSVSAIKTLFLYPTYGSCPKLKVDAEVAQRARDREIYSIFHITSLLKWQADPNQGKSIFLSNFFCE